MPGAFAGRSLPGGQRGTAVDVRFRAEVEDFAALRRSDESGELRFFGREELGELDIIETSRPILAAYLDPPREPFLEQDGLVGGVPHGYRFDRKS